jgi:hypothetical protein
MQPLLLLLLCCCAACVHVVLRRLQLPQGRLPQLLQREWRLQLLRTAACSVGCAGRGRWCPHHL